jgi:hypothetical protein
MKAFGFTETTDEAILLTDVALVLTPEAMREFARFVAYAASEMERLGAGYERVHVMDFSDTWQDHWPDIQLSNTAYG